MKQYYVAINEEKQGPFSISELQKIDLNKKTLVWYSGLNDWVNAEEIDELSHLMNDVPPPIPLKKSDSTKNIIIESPIDINIIKTSNISKDQLNENIRKATNKGISEIGHLIVYSIISLVVAFLTFSIHFAAYKPELVSDKNQQQFNREFSELNNKGSIVVPFGDIASKYLGFFDFKYDQNLSVSDLYNINEARLSILTAKSEDISYYVFFILLSLLILIRYIRIFSKWLNPSVTADMNSQNEHNK